MHQFSSQSSDPLRICLVATEGPAATGGLAIYARELAANLARDHQVTYISRFNRPLPRPLDYAEAEAPHDYSRDGWHGRVIAPSPLHRPALSQLLHLLTRTPTRGLATWLHQRAFLPPLRRAVPPGVEVIHYIGTGWELLGFSAAQVARERDAIFTIWPAVHPGSWGDSPVDIQLYRQADAVFAQSHFEKDHLARLGIDPARIAICRLAPPDSAPGNSDRFRQRHHLGDRPIVLFVGKKSVAKGYPALRSAMARVLQTFPDCCLVAIGPAEAADEPPPPQGAFIDLGIASDSDKSDAFAACDVFCMPSSAESFGIVYAEAWSYGKPVIVGPAPAARELVTHEVNGLHASQSPDEIAAALIRLLSDRSFAQKLGAAGRAYQQEHLTWEAVRQTHLDVFQQASAPCP